jgi:hypothetical protein
MAPLAVLPGPADYLLQLLRVAKILLDELLKQIYAEQGWAFAKRKRTNEF